MLRPPLQIWQEASGLKGAVKVATARCRWPAAKQEPGSLVREPASFPHGPVFAWSCPHGLVFAYVHPVIEGLVFARRHKEPSLALGGIRRTCQRLDQEVHRPVLLAIL